MALDLSSVQAKLRRAEAHLQSYRSYVQLWRDGKPYSISRERSADFTRFCVVLHVSKSADLEEWSLVIGDCVHNLRSALEHLIYAIAVHESGKNPPPKEGGLGFPIVDEPTDFTGKRVRDRIETLSEPVRAAIEAVQPYNRTHPATPPPLAILRDFANTDKHKLLRLAFASQYEGKVSLNLPNDRGGRGTVFANYGEVKDGTELIFFVFEKPEPDVNLGEIDIGIGISLWHKKRDPAGPAWSDRSEAAALLTLIAKEVRFVVDTIIAAVKK